MANIEAWELNRMEELEKLKHDVNEHTRAIKEFKHDMFMKYNNTNNKDKRSIILQKVNSIYEVMMLIHKRFVAEYDEAVIDGSEDKDTIVNDIKNNIDVFYEEVLSLR